MCSMGRTVSDISGHNQHWAKFLVPMCRWTPCQHFGTKIVVLRWFCREICHNIHIHMVTFEAIMDTAPYLGNLSQSAIFNFIFVISAPKLTGIDHSLPWHHDILGLSQIQKIFYSMCIVYSMAASFRTPYSQLYKKKYFRFVTIL